jgi:AmiR/NasT family two-component response regulator
VDNIEALPETSRKTLAELHLAEASDLVVAKRDMTALEAFKLMRSKVCRWMTPRRRIMSVHF